MRQIQNKTYQVSVALFGLAVAGMLSFGSLVQGQGNPEVAEMRAALQFTQHKLTQAEQQRKELIKSLAESVRVSEEKSFAAREVEEKMAAFGVDLFTSSKDSLEQRLLKAVRDLDILRQENERQRKAVHELSENFLNYIASTPGADDAAKKRAEEAIAKAGKTLNSLVGEDDNYVKRLEKSQVVSMDSKIGLVVIDCGRKSGVIVGTPILIERNEQALYTAIIVDVRDSISGALLQEKVGQLGAVKIGDRIRPLATETDL